MPTPKPDAKHSSHVVKDDGVIILMHVWSMCLVWEAVQVNMYVKLEDTGQPQLKSSRTLFTFLTLKECLPLA